MYSINSVNKLGVAIQNASKNPLLVELGLPTCDDDEIALTWLHLGAAYLKFSIIADLGEFYSARSGQALSELGFGQDVSAFGSAILAREHAHDAYLEAISEDPDFAEAHFGLARSIQLQKQQSDDLDRAIFHFRRCVDLQPHSLGLPHAYLHANAHWEIACILEDTGRDEEASKAYRKAISLLSTFGVHHIRAARFFRRLGLHDEASAQYMVCSQYTHRYYPEFVLPPHVPLEAENLGAVSNLDEVFKTLAGDSIYFENGTYVLVPSNEIWPEDAIPSPNISSTRVGSFLNALRSLFSSPKLQNNFRRGETIVELVKK